MVFVEECNHDFYVPSAGVIVQRMKQAMALVNMYSLRTLETYVLPREKLTSMHCRVFTVLVFCRLKGFCEPNNNYAIYRAEVADLQDSDVYIPALGVLLKDVAAIVEAVPNTVCAPFSSIVGGEMSRKHRWSKHAKMALALPADSC